MQKKYGSFWQYYRDEPNDNLISNESKWSLK